MIRLLSAARFWFRAASTHRRRFTTLLLTHRGVQRRRESRRVVRCAHDILDSSGHRMLLAGVHCRPAPSISPGHRPPTILGLRRRSSTWWAAEQFSSLRPHLCADSAEPPGQGRRITDPKPMLRPALFLRDLVLAGLIFPQKCVWWSSEVSGILTI